MDNGKITQLDINRIIDYGRNTLHREHHVPQNTQPTTPHPIPFPLPPPHHPNNQSEMVLFAMQSHTKNYGPDGTGSDIKWCVPKQQGYLVFDLMYPRFISRVELDYFNGPSGAGRMHDHWVKAQYSLDRNRWTQLYVSCIFSYYI